MERHPLNATGDWYVEHDCCILCLAPEAVAGGLMAHREDGCYFQRQPETPAEVDAAVLALQVSCVDCLRYAGRDPHILRRLEEVGHSANCDIERA